MLCCMKIYNLHYVLLTLLDTYMIKIDFNTWNQGFNLHSDQKYLQEPCAQRVQILCIGQKNPSFFSSEPLF